MTDEPVGISSNGMASFRVETKLEDGSLLTSVFINDRDVTGCLRSYDVQHSGNDWPVVILEVAVPKTLDVTLDGCYPLLSTETMRVLSALGWLSPEEQRRRKEKAEEDRRNTYVPTPLESDPATPEDAADPPVDNPGSQG